MTAAEKSGKGQQRGDRAIELRVAAQLENLAVLRTLVGAVGTFEDLDFDAVADLRLAVDEVCTRLIRSATPDATLAIVVDPRETNWWSRRQPHATTTTSSRRAASAGMC